MSELQQQVDDLRAQVAAYRRPCVDQKISEAKKLSIQPTVVLSPSARRCPGQDLALAPQKACHP